MCTSLVPCGSETALASLGIREFALEFKFDSFDLIENELRYAIALFDDMGRLAVVDQEYLDFSPVIGVYGAWAVENGDALVECESGSWAHLGFVPLGYLEVQPGADNNVVTGEQVDVLA
jgi:hypothetical protein